MRRAEDLVLAYAMARGWHIGKKTVILEGTTDENVYKLARELERDNSGTDLFAGDLCLIAAGEGEKGGTAGVVRELTRFRGLAECVLDANGRPKYRFIGLVDNDNAGRRAIDVAHRVDASILEYRDIFRIRPIMPTEGNLDPATLRHRFEQLNAQYAPLDWELEDLLPSGFIQTFVNESPSALRNVDSVSGQIHWRLTAEGKRRLHKFLKTHAMWEDMKRCLDVIRSIRFILNLQN